jgi:Ca2+/H+ antiporter, TMEM165/GDT1 family
MVVEFVAAVLPVFVASMVECVEAWTVVVAVGATRSWRAALCGVVAGLGAIAALLAVFGVALVEHVDRHTFQVVIGTLLLLFGSRWMRKAVLRSAGLLATHDEVAAFDRQAADLAGAPSATGRFDWLGASIAAKAMLLEGLEIVFLVVALGSSGDASYPVAVTGAATAFVFVGAVGLAARGPLSTVPENALKTFVAVMLLSFGCYWVAEGFGVHWAGGTWAILYLFAAWMSFVRVAAWRLGSADPLGEARREAVA